MEINTFFRLSDKGGVMRKSGILGADIRFGAICYLEKRTKTLDLINFCAKGAYNNAYWAN